MQEIVFFEQGEPIIDGDTGDLKVGFLRRIMSKPSTLCPHMRFLYFIAGGYRSGF